MSPEKGLGGLKILAIIGLGIEALGVILYIGARAAGTDITSAFVLVIIGFVILAVFLLMWKNVKRRTLG